MTEEINARPRKEFFIEKIIRDITLIDAIPDLIDNSVDGASRQVNSKTASMKKYWIHVYFDKKHFRIIDNCGGIDREHAIKYAFRIGRDPSYKPNIHSIGEFGIGMKRALFKMGNLIYVESRTTKHHYKIGINVDVWKSKPDDWTFGLDDIAKKDKPELTEIGTLIEVTQLHKAIADELDDEYFENELIEYVSSRHREYIDRGITITINGSPLSANPVHILESSQIKPAYEKIVRSDLGAKPLIIKMFAGINKTEGRGGAKPSDEAGWYVFCNGRLVIDADKSSTTGWGTEKHGKIPYFHPQYNAFRGYVFIDSDDSSILPWNTTKTGIDVNSEIFAAIFKKMTAYTRQVVDFINQLKDEKEKSRNGDIAGTPLNDAVGRAVSKKVVAVAVTEGAFRYPTPAQAKKADVIAISSYKKPRAQYEAVRDKLNARSAKEVGEKTFDYYYKFECKGG